MAANNDVDMESDAESELAGAENETNTTAETDERKYQRFKPQKAKKPKIDPVDAQLLELLSKESAPKPVAAEEADEDRGFFLSLWKDFKALPASKKVEVKMQLMQVM